MDQIIDKATLRTTQGHSEVQIRLKPEFLGNVKMTIAADKEQVMVRVVTDQPMVKEIIETHLHQLKTELQNQGLTIDKFDVMVNADADHQHSREQFAQMFKQHSSQNDRRQPQVQQPESAHSDNGHESDNQQPDRDGVNYFA
jgi:flagellar hook-length control protein FliK